MIKNLLTILSVIIVVTSYAQQQNLPLNREFNLVNQKVFNSEHSNTHTSFLPINQNNIHFGLGDASEINELDLPDDYLINISRSYKKERSWVIRKMFYENFLIVDTGNFYMTIDPLFNGEYGVDSEDNSGRTLYKNTRGAIIRANVGNKFSFETSLYENQMVLPNYLDNYVRSKSERRVVGVVPGQGRVKTFKENGFDFASSSAIVTYSPAEFLSLQMGTGKHFIGDGYRSLLLSDFSFHYPFVKITGTFGRNRQFQYTKLNAELSSLTRREPGSTPEELFSRKSMSTHYFSWLTTKWLSIGIFESTIWQTEDSSGTKPYQFQQLNPIIGINTATTGFEDINHSVIGSNMKIKLPFKAIVYNQFVYDGASRMGYQIGARFFGINNLTLQAEYNTVAQSTYTNSNPLQSYINYGEPIAHPLRDDFKEAIGIINYKFKRAFFQYKMIFAGQTNGNFTDLSIIQSHIGYTINPKNNMVIIAGGTIRDDSFNKTNYIYFGLRTNLRNLYDDF